MELLLKFSALILLSKLVQIASFDNLDIKICIISPKLKHQDIVLQDSKNGSDSSLLRDHPLLYMLKK
jgi:hypothetical protein